MLLTGGEVAVVGGVLVGGGVRVGGVVGVKLGGIGVGDGGTGEFVGVLTISTVKVAVGVSVALPADSPKMEQPTKVICVARQTIITTITRESGNR